MPQIGEAWIHIIPSLDGLGKSVKAQLSGADAHVSRLGSHISSTLGGAFKSAAVIGGAALAGATAYLASYAGEALTASDSAQKFGAALQFAGIDDSKIKALTESTKQYAARTVYDISDIRNVTAGLAANGVQGYEELAQAAGNLNAVAQGNAETFKTVGSVMVQTAGAGKLTTENWNQIRDAIPTASKKIKDALLEVGAYTGDFNEAMEKGEITADEFNAAVQKIGFSDIAVKAAQATDNFEGAWGNFQNTISDGLADLIDVFKGDLTGGISIASDALQTFFTNAKDLASGLRSIFKDGDFTGFGNLGIEEDSPIVEFFFDLREKADLFKASLLPLAGLAAGALGPLLSGLPVIGGAFAGLTGPVGLAIGLFAQMYKNSKAFRDGLADLGGAFAGAFESLAPAIEPVLTTVSTLTNILGRTLGTALSKLAPVVGELVAAIGGVLGPAVSGVGDILTQLALGFETVFTAVVDVVAGILPSITPVVEQVGAAFSALVEAVFPLIETLINSLKPVLDAVVPVLIDLGKQIFDTISSIMPVVMEVIGVIGLLVAELSPLIETIIGHLTPVIQSILTVVSTVFAAVKDVISAALNIISGVIKVVTGTIKGDWSQVWEGVKQIFWGIWEAIKAVVVGALKIIGSSISAGVQTIKGVWNAAWTLVSATFSNIWQGIKNAATAHINNVYNTVVGIKNRITGFFSGASSWLYNAGSAIIQGFIDGIYSAFDSVRSTLSELTNMLPDWKGPINVDRVILRDAGQLVIGGFVDGMESKYKDAQKSLGAFTKTLSNSPASWNSPRGAFDPSPQNLTRGYGVHVTQNIQTANVPAASDLASAGAEYARLIGVAL